MIRRMGTVLKGAAIASVLAFSGAGDARAETLAEALTDAYLNSGLIAQNRSVLRAADENVAQAVASLRPVVNWTADIQRQFGERTATSPLTRGFETTGISDETASARITANLTLYDGGANSIGVDIAKENVLAARAGLQSVEQQVLLRAVEAYMEVRRALETVSLRQNNVRVIEQELRAARDRFEVGEVTRTDVALAEARLAAGRSALAGARGSLDVAREEFRVAVGRAPGTLVPPRGTPALPASEAAARKAGVRNHPDILEAQHRVLAADLAIAAAKARLRPTVDLSGSLGVQETLGSDAGARTGSIGLSASGPIYQGGRLDSLIRQAMADRDQARSGLHLVRLGIEQRVGQAWSRVTVAQASRSAFEAQVRASTVAFRGVREEATQGARTTLDVLDAEQDLFDARNSLVSSQVDETIAAYTLLSSMGQLNTQRLGLPVPTFDPSAYYRLVDGAPARVSPESRELDRVLRALGKD